MSGDKEVSGAAPKLVLGERELGLKDQGMDEEQLHRTKPTDKRGRRTFAEVTR
jgi:hypothetical protein